MRTQIWSTGLTQWLALAMTLASILLHQSTALAESRLTLPADGRIPHKGMIDQAPKQLPIVKCTCETVTLARVETKKFDGYNGFRGSGLITPNYPKYKVTRHYDISEGRPKNVVIAELEYKDAFAIYFTFPEEIAYLVREGQEHPCTVKVEVTYPHTRSSQGYYRDTWQLFAIRGMADLKTAATNYIERIVSEDGHRIPAGGKGQIRWKVGSTICEPVPFAVRKASGFTVPKDD